MELPTGYHCFHSNAFFNYQLNRWYALGFARKEDMISIGRKIRTAQDYVREFTSACDRAIEEGRLKNAATYCRASEFLMEPADPKKIATYDKFVELFDQALADEKYERHQVPYANYYLSAIRFPAQTAQAKGTLIGIGGFDSFIEDFLSFWKFFAENGYDVIAFEGPGQGGSLRTHQLAFDHDWEKPTAAVLDYFRLDQVTALGISMGGYWVLRAAAFEKRIQQLIAMPPVYDWLELTHTFNKKLVNGLLKKKKIMNFLIKLKMRNLVIRHTIQNTLFLSQQKEPVEAVAWMLGMNKNHLHSHLVDQHVLLLGGEQDAFQPPLLLQKQKAALINAASVSVRIFSKSEQAEQHCQIGNIGLALESMLHWMTKTII
ncbi:alpha/beta fold hydrolase [Catalinimonas sp. 4WD22]|uniref:alpha/beta hydrolase n=1 Tax=Catalinimonas locisalis TaxID=3133978 RepID=UPI00310153CB